MASIRKSVATIYASLGVVLLILGIADVPSKILVWRGWYTSIAPHLHTMTARWVLGIVGVLIALFPWFVEWAKPVVDVQVTSTGGAGPSLEIIVENTGSPRRFAVQCELLALRNSPKPLRRDRFTLKWADSAEQWITLAQNHSAKASLATWEMDHKTAFASMSIVECSDKSLRRVEWSGWAVKSTEKLPEYDLKITVLGEGTRKSSIKTFTLRPAKWISPLELVPLTVSE